MKDQAERIIESATVKNASPVRDAFGEYGNVFISGFVVALVLFLFRKASTTGGPAIQKFQNSLTEHAAHLPMLLVDIAVFVIGLSLFANGPWGPILRKRVLRPILEFLLHNFGIAGGVFLFVWLAEAPSLTAATFSSSLLTMAVLQGLLLVFGFFLAFGSHICKHGLSDLISAGELERLNPQMKQIATYVPVPLGLLFMWLAYQEIIRISLENAPH